MDLAWATLIGVVVGALIGGLTALGTTWQNHRNQMERDRLQRSQELRDAKAERLRAAYKVILNATEAYQSAVHRYDVLVNAEEVEERNRNLNKMLVEALAPVNDAMIVLTLEQVGADIQQMFKDMRIAFNNYINELEDNRKYFPNPPWPDPKSEQAKVDDLAKKITAAMQSHLAEFERVEPARAVTSPQQDKRDNPPASERSARHDADPV